jgi:putative membrane protein
MAAAHHRWFVILGTVYLVLWAALAVAPNDRETWALENVLTVAAGVVLFATRRSFPFSRVSYSLIFAFLVLHGIGAHFTYAEVPYDDWIERVTGGSLDEALGVERNMYDRFVHFSFGLLLAYPAREIALRIANVRGFWGYFFPLLFVMASSAAFEGLEWLAVLIFGDRVGMTYLATQGDPWDPQKDMTLATLGGLIAMAVTALINGRLQRDFARDWAQSLRVKRKTPLGEGAPGTPPL